MAGKLVLITGDRQSGKSVFASDEMVPWLRKQPGNGVVLIDVNDEPNWVTVEHDQERGYHVCAVIQVDVHVPTIVRNRADIIIRLDRVVRIESNCVQDREGTSPWWNKGVF